MLHHLLPYIIVAIVHRPGHGNNLARFQAFVHVSQFRQRVRISACIVWVFVKQHVHDFVRVVHVACKHFLHAALQFGIFRFRFQRGLLGGVHALIHLYVFVAAVEQIAVLCQPVLVELRYAEIGSRVVIGRAYAVRVVALVRRVKPRLNVVVALVKISYAIAICQQVRQVVARAAAVARRPDHAIKNIRRIAELSSIITRAALCNFLVQRFNLAVSVQIDARNNVIVRKVQISASSPISGFCFRIRPLLFKFQRSGLVAGGIFPIGVCPVEQIRRINRAVRVIYFILEHTDVLLPFCGIVSRKLMHS